MASLTLTQIPPQQNPASIHAWRNHGGMSVISVFDRLYGFDGALISMAVPMACSENRLEPPTVRHTQVLIYRTE